jgi:hypothetical protein
LISPIRMASDDLYTWATENHWIYIQVYNPSSIEFIGKARLIKAVSPSGTEFSISESNVGVTYKSLHIQPGQSFYFYLRLPFLQTLETGIWTWHLELLKGSGISFEKIDQKTLALDVQSGWGYPDFAGSKQLGTWKIMDLGLSESEQTYSDAMTFLNLVCLMLQAKYHIPVNFFENGGYSPEELTDDSYYQYLQLVEGAAAAARQTAAIDCTRVDNRDGTSTLRLDWANRMQLLEGAQTGIKYDRAVIILTLPSPAQIDTESPQPDFINELTSDDGSVVYQYTWVLDFNDQRLVPSFTSYNGAITLKVQNLAQSYEVKGILSLQLGPFNHVTGGAIGPLEEFWSEPVRRYDSWAYNPSNVVWMVVGMDEFVETIPAIDTFTVSVSAGANGQITPGTGLVNYGATPTYSITPNVGYHIASITVNGGSVAVTSPKGQSYQFAPITSDGSIAATFAIDTFVWPFEDGFESGSFSNWTSKSNTAGETATVVNSQNHHGTYSALSMSNGNGGTERAYCYKTLPSETELYSRGYFFVSASGIAANDNRFYFLIFKAGSQSVAFAGWRMTGGVVKWNLLIRHGTGWTTVYSTTSPVLNQWYSVELHWKEDAASGLGELWVNGVLVCSSSGKNTAYYGDVNRVEFGLPELVNCAATQAYVDCCVISMLPIGPESPQVSVHLESSQDTSTTSNQGTIVLDSVPYALPIDVLKTLSTYSVAYTEAAGYSFDHWEASGGISVASTSSQSTTVTVSGTGTLRAVYRAVAPPSVIFEDGFESGDFSKWTGKSSTATVVNTKAKQGIYSGMFTSNGGGGTERSYCYKTIGPLTELYASGYFFVSSSGIAANDNRFYLLIFKAGSQSVAFAGWRMTGGVVKWNLLIRHGTGWTTVYSTTSPVLNQWYSVELHWKEDATNGFAELWVDGVRVCFASGKNTAYYGDVNRVEFGLPELVNCGPTTVYGDSCVVSKARIAPAAANQPATMTITSETKRIKQR